MRAVIREILARRMPHPPEEFVAIQVSRLNEALLVAFSAMAPTNLKAVDQVVKIVRELDRYGGAFAAEWARPEASPRTVIRGLDTPAEGAAAFGAAWVCRAESPSPRFSGERVGVRGLGDWPRTLTRPLILTFSPHAGRRDRLALARKISAQAP